MLSTFKATVASLVRNPAIMVWVLAFPVILSTVFMVMFAELRTDGSVDAVPVAVVADDAWEASTFSQVVDVLSEGEDGSAEPADAQNGAAADTTNLLAVTEVRDETSAQDLLAAGQVDGIFRIDAENQLRLTVAPESSLAHQGARSSDYSVNRSILETVASSYTQADALLESIATENPAVLSNSAQLIRALSLDAPAERVSLTRSQPDETVRYYYALLGMSVVFSAQMGLFAVAGIRPTVSPVAARRSVAGVSRVRQLAGSALAAWVLAFAFLTAAFLYIRFVVGIDFAGREALCLVGIAAGAWLATGLGALVGMLPLRGTVNAGSGLLTALACALSLFAGLYGEPAMQFADAVARAVPISAWINPVKLACDLFYSLYFYESLVPFTARLAACVAMGAVFFAIAIPLFRRQRYAHL